MQLWKFDFVCMEARLSQMWLQLTLTYYVIGFAKRILSHTSNLPILKYHNVRLGNVNALKF